MNLQEFARDLLESVLAGAGAGEDGEFQENVFTEQALEILTEHGECVSPRVAYYRDRVRGLKVNGYDYSNGSIDDDTEMEAPDLDLFVADFDNGQTIRSIPASEVDKDLQRGRSFLKRCLEGQPPDVDLSTEVHELIQDITAPDMRIGRARIFLLTNRLAGRDAIVGDAEIGDVHISHHVWDIERLYQASALASGDEPIAINFADQFGGGLPCIRPPQDSGDYDAYLALIPGWELAELYGKFGQRLLERNVRAFLQTRGAVNKGIKRTLSDEPSMFLAYNNGISATADSATIELSGGEALLMSITNLQIVNGGQTTASIYDAYKRKVDISRVFVQMKLTVLHDPSRVDEVVPLISRYANSQTKVNFSDFSANEPYHLELERLSRTIWANPDLRGKATTHWYYERARGQYGDEKLRQRAGADRRKWEIQHPAKQRLTKTLIAKYEMCWHQYPNWVSEGAEKNFGRFTQWLTTHPINVDAAYFQELVAKAIVFQVTDAIVQKLQLGGYKANIAAYTVAWFSHLRGQRFDLKLVWGRQGLSDDTQRILSELATEVWRHLSNPPSNARNISEWCKKEACWASLKARRITVPDLDTDGYRQEPVEVQRVATAARQGLSAAVPTTAEVWFALARWGKATKALSAWELNFSYNLGMRFRTGYGPMPAQVPYAQRTWLKAKEAGFIEWTSSQKSQERVS